MEIQPTVRARHVWQHLAGLYGADTLERKYGLEPTPEWCSAIEALTDEQLTNGMEALVRSGNDFLPTLPGFMAACRNARQIDNAVPPRDFGQHFDKWDIAGNDHLLAVVLRHMRKGEHFTPDATKVIVGYKNSWAGSCRDAAGPSGSIDPRIQKANWEDCMERAYQHGGAPTPRHHPGVTR